MANRSALVYHLDPGLLEHRHILRGIVAGCFHDPHATVDNRLEDTGVIRRRKARQKSHIDAKGLVRHGAATGDFCGELLRRALRQAGNDTQSTGIGDGGGKFRQTNKVHTTLDYRVLYAQQFGNSCFHDDISSIECYFYLMAYIVS